MNWTGDLQELVEALFHLVLCGECRERAHVLEPEKARCLMLRVFGRENPPTLSVTAALEPEVQRAFEGLRERFSFALDELSRLEEDLMELLSHSPAHRELLIANSQRFCRESLAWWLLEEVKSTWKRDPEEAEALAQSTLEIARRLPRTLSTSRRLNDLSALALAHRANCRRIRSKLAGSSRDFERARIYLAQGEGNPMETAEIDELESSLHRDRRRFVEAERLIQRAMAAYRALGDVQGEARMMIVQAMLLRAEGRQGEACDLLDSVLSIFGSEDIGEEMEYWAVHNLTMYLTELGNMERARELLPRVRYLAQRFADRFELVRLVWLEAMVLERTGEPTRAIDCYAEVLDFFVERRIGYDAALVALDLAALYLDTGRLVDAKELAAQLVPLFEVHEVHREAAAALALFFEAVEQERATPALARDVANFLKTTRDRSGERYEPSSELLGS